jgi:SAM-dependent methyltransferase
MQYGCGPSAPQGWVNFDASPTLRLQRLPLIGKIITQGRVVFPKNVFFGDVVKGLPIGSASCRNVYCSHVLEHLSLVEFRKALRETLRVLKPGGVFRGVLPDLEVLAKAYVADGTPSAALTFMRDSMLGVCERRHGLRGLASAALGNSHHLWMWDYKAVAAELAQAGFVEIRRASFGDSGDEAFDVVEDRSRWDGCLGFHCIRTA